MLEDLEAEKRVIQKQWAKHKVQIRSEIEQHGGDVWRAAGDCGEGVAGD